MFEKIRNLFRRKNYASSYYGKGNKPLFTSPMPPMQVQQPEPQELPKSVPAPVQVQEVEKKEPADPDWEQRRFELMKMLLAQERRSVVLGKLQASNKQIANTARVLADAGIRELMNHPMEESHDTRREANAE
jgi:hypothetical protein